MANPVTFLPCLFNAFVIRSSTLFNTFYVVSLEVIIPPLSLRQLNARNKLNESWTLDVALI
jgi:hypothetical protein